MMLDESDAVDTPEIDSNQEAEVCEGCNGSGIRCPATPSCRLPEGAVEGWPVVERCDTCEFYEDDLSAASSLFRESRWIECASGGDHAIGRYAFDSASA